MAFPALAAWMTGTDPQRTLRMMTGAHLGRPTATFAGGISPTTQGGSHGVIGGGDLLVSISSGLQMTVAAGGCFINGTSANIQGCYYGYNDAAYAGANVLLSAHNAQPRIDLIYARVRDNAEDAGGSTLFELNKATGTPAGSPTPPTVPSGCLVLAQIAVPATSGAVTVTDTRCFAAGLGGLIRCKSTTRPTGVALWTGQPIYETDTTSILVYTGSGFDIVSEAAQAWNVTSITQSGSVACTTTSGSHYQRNRGTFDAILEVTATASGAAGAITIPTPLTLTGATMVQGTWQFYDASDSNRQWSGVLQGNSTTQVSLAPNNDAGTASAAGFGAVVIASGDIIRIGMRGRYA